jgi:aspartyl-tRNA synthetase
MEKEEIEAKFGFLVEAYKYASPPHGGMASALTGCNAYGGAPSIRDVIAFPKVQNASELMSGAPAVIDDIQLDELGIELAKKEDE